MTRDQEFNDQDDILRLKLHLGADEDFYPSDDEVDDLVARVDRAIDAVPDHSVPAPTLRTPLWLGIAASLVLILGASWLSFKYGESVGTTVFVDTTAATTTAPPVAEVAAEDVTLDADAVAVLLEEISDDYTYGAAERLLDDLTEAELEYLEKTFDVGDLL